MNSREPDTGIGTELSLRLKSTNPGVNTAIQPAIWPEAGISTEVTPYFRLEGPAGMSLSRGGIEFAKGGSVSSNGYFNLFNLGKWRDYCGEMPLGLHIEGSGRFHLTLWVAPESRSWERIFSEVITLDGTSLIPLALSDIADPRAIVFFELTALSDGRLSDFAWTTPTPPRRTPELVLSVTTFKREEAVSATVERFLSFRRTSPLREHIRMNIVDNGNSVQLQSCDGVTVISNENLGGAGGFTRGLLEARATGASHCIFMDDDASMHMGAVTRTWMLLAYSLDPSTAVAGAMINGSHRWQIWENGAVFDRGCRPQYFGTDMRDLSAVYEMEFRSTGPSPEGFYAGWWFFAFPLEQVTHLPFPFFVRGDDVSFSLVNNFRTVTLPGVASVQEAFPDKASPLTWYLDLRSHLAHHLSIPKKKISIFMIERMIFRFYLRNVLRFHYDSLAAINLAIEDVMEGPSFFAANADMAERRQRLREIARDETWRTLPRRPDRRHGRLSRPMRALLLATLNGHLLPFSNLLGSDLVIESSARENYREVYGARKITYLNTMNTAAYTVQRDRIRFWRESYRLVRNCLNLRRSYQRLIRDWQGSYQQMTSETFWNAKLKLRDE